MREARGGVLWLAAGGGVAQHDETNGNSTSTWSPSPAPQLQLELETKVHTKVHNRGILLVESA